MSASCFRAIVVATETVDWGVERIGARSVWDKDWNKAVDYGAYAGNGITVAVIDNDGGIDRNHTDLQGNIVGGKYVYYDFIRREVRISDDYNDTYGHSTKVAGVIAAVDNDDGILGASPRVGIYAIKLQKRAIPEVDEYAIRYAADRSDIKIIVLPYVFPLDADPSRLVESACNYAYDQGKLVVAGAGINNRAVEYPANVSSVVAVGAVDEDDERWESSNYGSELDFVAPGVNINLTNLGGGYVEESGTSYSAPYLAAAAALFFEAYPYINVDGGVVWEILNYTAYNLGASGWDEQFGMGLVNAYSPCQLPLGDVNGDHIIDISDAAIVGVFWVSSR